MPESSSHTLASRAALQDSSVKALQHPRRPAPCVLLDGELPRRLADALTPFRLDGLALGAFLAVTMRQPGGLERLVRALPWVVGAAGVLPVITFGWTRLVSRQGLELVLPVRVGLIIMLLGCLLVWALIAQERSLTSRFFRSRVMVFLGTYSYGLYVYHHFISYYLTTNHTHLELASSLMGRQWLYRPRWAPPPH